MATRLPGSGTDNRGLAVVIGLIILSALIELLLQLGDAGLIGVPRFRNLVYEYGGFWPGLLDDWRPNYPFQRWSMFHFKQDS